ncbi:hypothetical protein H0H92_000477, partial [Tricholoma furcatifolium]
MSSESRERLFNETVDEIFQQIRNELASALLGCLHRYSDELLDISGPSSSGFKRSSSSPLAPPIVSVEDSPPIKKRQLPDRSAMPSYAPVEVDTGAASTSTFGLNITPISDTRSTSAPATPYSPSSIDETIEAMARPWELLYPPARPTTC